MICTATPAALLTLALLQQTPPTQDPIPASAPATTPAAAATSSASVEDLRARIHGLRMSLLFGGDKVKSAETEAIDFYNQRIEATDKTLDSIQTDLAEKRATYDVAIEQALSGKEGATAAMQRAQGLRTEIAGLEHDSADFVATRTNLGKLVQTVQARQRERDTLAARLDASSAQDIGAGFTLGSVGLAPDVEVHPSASPYDDPSLIQDLVRRDPVGAGRLLFAADPSRYFELFPLIPPETALRKALAFPLPDLPGKR